MIKNITFLVFVIIIIHTEGRSYRTKENNDISSKEKKNRQELLRIVRVLNGNIGRETKSENAKKGVRYYINPKKLVEVLEKKYPNRFSNIGPGIRFHYIKNPQVLDDFVKNLRRQNQTEGLRRLRFPDLVMQEVRSSSSSDSSDDSSSGNDVEGVIRRKAIFHAQDRSDENQNGIINHDTNEDNPQNFPPSLEEQVTPFRPHVESLEGDKKSVYVSAPTKRFTVKSKDNIVIAKTDEAEWNPEYPLKKGDNSNEKRDSHRGIKEKPNNIEKKDIVEKEDRVRSSKKKRKDTVKVDEFAENDTSNKKPRKVRRKKKDRELRKQDLDRVEDWNTEKKKSTKYNSLEAFVEPKRKEVKKGRKKPRYEEEVNNDWDKVGREWAKGQTEDSRPSRPGNRWKKQPQRDVYPKPSYVARIPEYHKKSRGREGTFQGRTPIPFVGKKGIYEDK